MEKSGALRTENECVGPGVVLLLDWLVEVKDCLMCEVVECILRECVENEEDLLCEFGRVE